MTPLTWQGCEKSAASTIGQHITADENLTKESNLHWLAVGEGEKLGVYLGQHGEELTAPVLALLLRQIGLLLDRREWRQYAARSSNPTSILAPPLTLPGLIYNSDAMRKVIEQIHRLRSSNITVLITGESGTGKELIARGIHLLSSRAAHPFIAFNCAATPRELIESHLFGHRSGAFTGAKTDFPGVIGAAAKGTLFLDEIGELALDIQPKLLRFLQDGEIHRLGEAKPRTADVRVIAATNRQLEAMVAAGEFRSDLFYRLNVIQFHLPSLRERREEIPLLAEHFLRRYTAQEGKTEIHFTPAVIEALRRFDWPGNARQLENEIQRLVALTATGERITPDLLSAPIRQPEGLRLVSSLPALPPKKKLAERVRELECELILAALEQYDGNISRAADELGLSRFGLRKMIARHGLTRDFPKNGASDRGQKPSR